MTIRKHRRYVTLFIAIILALSCFALGEITVYAQEISATTLNLDSYYIGQNNRRLFGLILVGLIAFGAIKGWRRAVVLGSFLAFLAFASIVIFILGKLIAMWLNSSDSRFIPVVVFFIVGILIINRLHKLLNLIYDLLKKHLYKK